MQIGYCGNVHPGRTIEEVKHNLTMHSFAVKQLVCPNHPMGIGLWLSATAARELDEPEKLDRFRDWLIEAELLPFTFNGFPFGDFHQGVVKHEVYLPTWAESSRLEYTVRLAEIQHHLLPDMIEATISTLPLGWPVIPGLANDKLFLHRCASNLRKCAIRLSEIEQASGRRIIVCIEPEPGCLIDTCDDMTGFFSNHLLSGHDQQDEITLRHIGVCHDICHSAVMFEEQTTAMAAYRDSGIRVGKVQVSSAINVDFANKSPFERQQILEQLSSFAEPRYLHQTCVRENANVEFFEDLPLALKNAGPNPSGQWRVHFHVPIFSHQLGLIESTQAEIAKCVADIQSSNDPTHHFEIETYAWNVLPEHLQESSLAIGIAKEMKWFAELVEADFS